MNEAAPSLRILIADDHDMIRQGARAVLSLHPGWEVCGFAKTGREAVTQAEELKPAIVVMDMTMPELNGLEAAIQIKRRSPDTEILMFTAHESDDLIRDAFQAGMKSFIFKSEAHDCLVQAIESLSQHKPFFTAKVSEILFSRIHHGAEAHRDTIESGPRLTAREREIVQLIAEGNSNKEVAEALAISVRTAEVHRAAILRKVQVDSVAELVRYAIRNKIIEP